MQQFQSLFGGSPLQGAQSLEIQAEMDRQEQSLRNKGLWDTDMQWNGARWVRAKDLVSKTPTDVKKPVETAVETPKWQKDVARVEELGGGGLSMDIKNNLGLMSATPGFEKSTGYGRSKFTTAMSGALGKRPAKQKPVVTNKNTVNKAAVAPNGMDQLASLLGGQ